MGFTVFPLPSANRSAGPLTPKTRLYSGSAKYYALVMYEDEDGYKPPPHPAEWKLLLACLLPGLAGLAGLFASPDGANRYSLGSLGVMAASVLIYASGVSLLRRSGTFDSSVRWLTRMGGYVVIVGAGVALISAFTSDKPAGADAVYAGLWLLAGAGAVYYGYYYRVNTGILELLGPLGFRLADSGPFGRDGKYDVRGEWKGVTTLVNLNQTYPQKGGGACFSLEICCELKNWSGRRLLLQPKGFLNRSLGLPLFIPSAQAPGWEAYGVCGEPPEAAGGMLTTIEAEARAASSPEGFAYLLVEKGRLRLGCSGDGYPARGYVKRRLDLAASAAVKRL